MRSVNTQNLVLTVDLSKIQPGSNTIPITPQSGSPSFRAFEVVDMTPPRLGVQAEPPLERTLPLSVNLQTDFTKGVIEVRDIRTTPEMVLVRGPKSTVAALKAIAVPLQVGATTQQGTHRTQVSLTLPPLVTATPPTVTVQYEVVSSRKAVVLQRSIVVDNMGRTDLMTKIEQAAAILKGEIK